MDTKGKHKKFRDWLYKIAEHYNNKALEHKNINLIKLIMCDIIDEYNAVFKKELRIRIKKKYDRRNTF